MTGERSSGWTVREVEGGHTVFFRGQRWPMEPRANRQSCVEYARRLADRWTAEGALLMMRPRETKSRGGPWRYTYPNGKGEVTGVIQTARLADAKTTLRRKLRRQRLPVGIEWEVAR